MKFGLVFKDDETVYLGCYDQDRNITSFDEISDFNGIYDSLNVTQFSFVEIGDGDDTVDINDICSFTISDPDGNDAPITEMLHGLNFPSEETHKAFAALYADGIVEKKSALQ